MSPASALLTICCLSAFCWLSTFTVRAGAKRRSSCCQFSSTEVGKLLITPDGRMTTHLIKAKDIPYENAAVTAAIDSVHQMVKAVTSEVIAHSDYRLVRGHCSQRLSSGGERRECPLDRAWTGNERW